MGEGRAARLARAAARRAPRPRARLRRYSASPGEAFLTGGGLHRFANFDHRDDGKVVPLKEAFRNSINLPFIRLMRDLVDHLISRTPGGGRNALEDRTDPRRETYLTRFVERESRTFLRQFYGRYRGLSREAAIARLFAAKKLTPKRVAVVLRTQDPEAGYDAFAAEMARRVPAKLPDRGDARGVLRHLRPRPPRARRPRLPRGRPPARALARRLPRGAPGRDVRRGARGEPDGTHRGLPVALPLEAQGRAGQAHPLGARARRLRARSTSSGGRPATRSNRWCRPTPRRSARPPTALRRSPSSRASC